MGGKSIYLWNTRHYGVPKDMAELEQTYDRLRDGVADTRQEGFIKFATLFSQYLSSHQAELEDEIHRRYKQLIQQAQQHQHALIHLDLPDDEWLATLRIILTITPSCDLLVFERDLNMAFLPPYGKVLPESEASLWRDLNEDLDAPADFPRTKAQFNKYIKPYIDTLMRKHGFKKNTMLLSDDSIDAYSRLVPLGKQYISGLCEKGGGGSFVLELDAYVESPDVLSIYNLFDFSKFGQHTFSTSIERLDCRGPWRVEAKFEFDLALVTGERLLMPLLDEMQTLKDLNRLLNGEASERLPDEAYQYQYYAPQRLIIARLVGSPNFEALVTEFEGYQSFAGNEWQRATEWPKLVKYLREEVEPLG